MKPYPANVPESLHRPRTICLPNLIIPEMVGFINTVV